MPPTADPIRVRARVALPCFACALALATCALAAPVRAQIDAPGHHARYSAELEPHLVWQWDGSETAYDDGVGFGFRASIPVLQDGPVPSINNNLAISFGFDWAHFGDDCRYLGVPGDCSEDDFWIPVAMQWNFFLTQMISVFPELGLGFRDASFDNHLCGNRPCRGSDLEVHLVLWFGARFRLSDLVALTVRLGTPSLQFGVSFFL